MRFFNRIIYETGGASCAAMMRRGCASVKMNKNGLNSTAGGLVSPAENKNCVKNLKH